MPNTGLARPPSPILKKKQRSTRANTMNEKENGDKEAEVTNEQEWNGEDHIEDLDDDDYDDDDEKKSKKKKKKKSYYVKKRKPVEDEIIEDPSLLTENTGGPLEPLAKKIRQPAQDKAYKELSAINERIASLVQVRQMGLSTPENKKQLKLLMADRKKKAYELKRLQSKQRASNKYRMKKKKIVTNHLIKKNLSSI